MEPHFSHLGNGNEDSKQSHMCSGLTHSGPSVWLYSTPENRPHCDMSVYTSCGIEPCSDSEIWVLVTEKKGVGGMHVREREEGRGGRLKSGGAGRRGGEPGKNKSRAESGSSPTR